jgi:hypothetical protein
VDSGAEEQQLAGGAHGWSHWLPTWSAGEEEQEGCGAHGGRSGRLPAWSIDWGRSVGERSASEYWIIVLHSLGTYRSTLEALGRAVAWSGDLTTWRRGQTSWGGGDRGTLTLDAPPERNP